MPWAFRRDQRSLRRWVPISGTTDSINAITRDQIFEHYQARYTSEHLVAAAQRVRQRPACSASHDVTA
jgi:hypothetical protein